MYGVLAMAHIWGLFAPTSQTWIYSFWKRLMGSICWGKELAGFMMFNDDCTPPWKSRLVSSIRRPEKLPWLEISVGKIHLCQPWNLGSTQSFHRILGSRVNSLGRTIGPLEVFGFHLARATGDLEFRGLLRPKSQPSHHAQRREVPDAALHAILSHAVGGVGTSRWGSGGMARLPHVYHVLHAASRFLWIALCCMGSRAKKILFLW